MKILKNVTMSEENSKSVNYNDILIMIIIIIIITIIIIVKLA